MMTLPMGGRKGKDVRRRHDAIRRIEARLKARIDAYASPPVSYLLTRPDLPIDRWQALRADELAQRDDRDGQLHTKIADAIQEWQQTQAGRRGTFARWRGLGALRRVIWADLVRELEVRLLTRADALWTAQRLLADAGRRVSLRALEQAVARTPDTPNGSFADLGLAILMDWPVLRVATDFDVVPEFRAMHHVQAGGPLPTRPPPRPRGRPPKT